METPTQPTNVFIAGNPPQLGENQTWAISGYLHGRFIRQSPRKFKEFTNHQYIGESKGSYHFLADSDNSTKVLVCTIKCNCECI